MRSLLARLAQRPPPSAWTPAHTSNLARLSLLCIAALALRQKKKFVDWLDLNELCAGYSLKQLLLAPVTRMPQYLIMLGAIVRSLDPASPSAQKLLAAVAAVSKVTDEIAQALKDEVSRKLVVTLQARIFGNNCNLISPHRFVVKHSDLKKMYNNSLFGGSSKVYLFILFNDCLIYGTRPGRLMSGSIKHVLPLVGMSLEDERDDEAKKVKNGTHPARRGAWGRGRVGRRTAIMIMCARPTRHDHPAQLSCAPKLSFLLFCWFVLLFFCFSLSLSQAGRFTRPPSPSWCARRTDPPRATGCKCSRSKWR